jgi:hypothetical protein
VQPATLIALQARHPLRVPRNTVPISEGKVPIVPRPKRPGLIEPEERTPVLIPVAEVIGLEKRDMTEPEERLAVAELEHEAALSKVTETSRFELWNMSELQHDIPVAEVI